MNEFWHGFSGFFNSEGAGFLTAFMLTLSGIACVGVLISRRLR